ncbi:hypothetical protein BJ684DRAFT_12623, partial [Piptocephalis cylindrospora]
SLVTTLPAPILTPSPMVTPAQMMADPPTHTSLPIVMGLPDSIPSARSLGSRGCVAV